MPEQYCVIMAGGRGERFWPQSRQARPKHLLPIVGQRPMVAQTVERLQGLIPPERIFILTSAEHLAAVKEACPEIPLEQIVGEPVGRDTAPAAALAALLVRRKDAEGVFALLPADAAIHDAAGFRAVLSAAFQVASNRETIVTIGIPPTYPATGYGYLKRGATQGQSEGKACFVVERFVEKPDRATAEKYLQEGIYLWNAGMFVMRAKVLEDAIRVHAPAVAAGMAEIETRLKGGESLAKALAAVYANLPKISLDYAVMEKAAHVSVFEAAFDWDDVGEWPALVRHFPADGEGNIIQGAVALHEARNNLVVGTPGHVVALLGVDDLVVVQTKDATLVCPKHRAQDLKKLLQQVAALPDGARWL